MRFDRHFVIPFATLIVLFFVLPLPATAQPVVVIEADTLCIANGFGVCEREHPHGTSPHGTSPHDASSHDAGGTVSFYEWSRAEVPLLTVQPGAGFRLIAPDAGPLGDTMFIRQRDYGPLVHTLMFDGCASGGWSWRLAFRDSAGTERLSAEHSCEGVLTITSDETTLLLPYPMVARPEEDLPMPGVPSGSGR